VETRTGREGGQIAGFTEEGEDVGGALRFTARVLREDDSKYTTRLMSTMSEAPKE